MLKITVSREFGFYVFGAAVLFTLVSTLSMLAFRRETESENLRRQILELSQRYVLSVIREDQLGLSPVHPLADGPVSGGRFSQHDLSRTIAVVLSDVLTRLERLELVVKNKTLLCPNSVEVSEELMPSKQLPNL